MGQDAGTPRDRRRIEPGGQYQVGKAKPGLVQGHADRVHDGQDEAEPHG